MSEEKKEYEAPQVQSIDVVSAYPGPEGEVAKGLQNMRNIVILAAVGVAEHAVKWEKSNGDMTETLHLRESVKQFEAAKEALINFEKALREEPTDVG